jgi:hypothetical protein
MQRRPHQRRLDDVPPCHSSHQILLPEPLDARPQTEIRRGRPLGLEAGDSLDRSGRRHALAA